MPRIIADRVMETSVSEGTGPIALAGAVAGYRTFAAVCTVADTFDYAIYAVDSEGLPTGEWETGVGSFGAGSTINRDTFSASSTTAPISFGAGSKVVVLAANAATLASFKADTPAIVTDPYGSHTHWRLFFTASSSGYVALSEVEFRSSPGNTVEPASYVAGGQYQSNGPDRAFDKDFNTYYESQQFASVGTNVWVGGVFSTPRSIMEVALAGNPNEPGERPTAMRIDYSDDGTNWVTAWVVTGMALSLYELSVFQSPDYGLPLPEEPAPFDRYNVAKIVVPTAAALTLTQKNADATKVTMSSSRGVALLKPSLVPGDYAILEAPYPAGSGLAQLTTLHAYAGSMNENVQVGFVLRDATNNVGWGMGICGDLSNGLKIRATRYLDGTGFDTRSEWSSFGESHIARAREACWRRLVYNPSDAMQYYYESVDGENWIQLHSRKAEFLPGEPTHLGIGVIPNGQVPYNTALTLSVFSFELVRLG